MGISESMGHMTTSNTTISLTPEGIERSQETDLRPMHQLSYTLTTSSGYFLRQTKPPKGGPETTSVIDNVSTKKTRPDPCFLCLFFWGGGGRGGGGKGEYRSSPSSLICRHPVYMMTNKMGRNPDRVVASLKNRK
jgi:hypothetical protein